ncbi:MAG: SUMF1/EgtB/PvdO family nonheme iron enzyme, partial [Acidobacteriota bacterium]
AIPDQSMPTLTTEVVSISRSQPEDASPHCPRCGGAATPYAQFCDVCGQSLTSSEIEPFDIEPADDEVNQTTLEVNRLAPIDIDHGAIEPNNQPSHLHSEQIEKELKEADVAEEAELDPSRTTERVLARESKTPDTSPMGGSPETYSTQESQPVTITELYYGDDIPHLSPGTPSDEIETPPDEQPPHHRTTSFEPRRSTSDVRMTIESRVISTGQIEDTSEEELNLDEEEFVEAPLPKRMISASLAESPDRSKRALWQAGGILLCLLVLFSLIAVIAWQEIAKRRGRAGPAPGTTPTTSTTANPATPEGMIRIPGGTFNMGRDGGDVFERPVHSVTVAPFLIDRTEVTNEQYQKFITETRREAPAHWQDGRFPPNEGNYPVINVSWQDATDYARWAGKRLPTEGEWEFAARGSQGRIYPWGSKWESGRANARGSAGRIVAVGSFPQGASPFGVLDLSGNVWEWTANELTSYAEADHVLAPGRVIRGGAYDVPPNRATATYRGVVQPERTYDKTGFRCVK